MAPDATEAPTLCRLGREAVVDIIPGPFLWRVPHTSELLAFLSVLHRRVRRLDCDL